MFQQIKNFVFRYFGVAVLFVIGIFYLAGQKEVLSFIASVFVVVSISLVLANISIIAFTKIDFSPKEVDSDSEKLAKIIASGLIFLGTSIIVAGCVFGMYYLQFLK